MKLLEVTTKNDAGEHQLDWNKLIELLVKLAGIAGIIVGVWATKQGQKQQEFLKYQFTPQYLNQVEQGNAPNQQRK
jgi:hypothetical protein